MTTTNTVPAVAEIDADTGERRLVFYIDPTDLDVDLEQWNLDDVTVEWAQGEPGIFVSFTPVIDDEELWEDEFDADTTEGDQP